MAQPDLISDSWFKQVFESAPDPAWIIDGNRVVECNEAAIRVLGYTSREELLNVLPSKLSPPKQADGEDSLTKAERMESLAFEAGVHRFEWIHRKADGTNFNAEVTLARIEHQGRPIIYCVWRNITDRKSIEEKLQRQNSMLSAIVENFPGGISLFDAELKLAAHNNQFGQLMDFPAALFEKPEPIFEDFVRFNAERGEYGQADVEQQVAAMIDRAHNFQAHQIERVRPNGTVLEIRGTPLPSGGFVTVYIDVTERKQQEEKTRELLTQHETILNNALVGIAYLKHRLIVSCNRRLEEIFHYAPGELIGASVEKLYDTRETFEHIGQVAYAAVSENRNFREEVKLKHKDGSVFWGELSGRAIDPNYPHEGSTWVYADISELKQAEADLRISASAFESQEGMLITDANNVIVRVNRAFTEITGYEAEEAVGQTPKILSSGRHNAEFFAEMWASIERTGGWQGEVWDRRKNGENYPIWLTITAVKSANGAITHYIGSHVDITERKQADERIKQLAFYDPLTGLPNRRLLLDRLQQVLASRLRSARYGALLFVDLDNFKTLNDTLGHDTGDLLLKQVAQRMVSCVREGDTVARLGGDEFVVMLDDLSENVQEAATQVETVGGKILAELNLPYQLCGTEHRNTPSIGVTLFVDHDGSIDELLKRADLAMYQAKAAGRNTLRFFDPEMQATVMRRAALEAEMRDALEKSQFVLYYQAQVIGMGRLTGAEVLLRWQHPLRGMVSPGDFIPLAEDTGLILPLGHWVLMTACTQLASWATQPEMTHLTVAVNVSVRQFRLPNFVEEVLAVLAQTGANPQRLKLELTETLLVTDVEDIIAKMSALKTRGVGFSLDDFGTGYSSLSYLKRLPLDQLKIDQEFVREILTDPNDAAIAKMIIALGESMGLAVIAEGVEIDAQRDFLARHGCHAYQGYLFSRPLPVEEFESLARRA